MIKKLINFIKNMFKCERQDPHLVMYEEIKKNHCDNCPKYKHRCPDCQEAVK
tara:strand:+ start:374 stop:529 length:156 start_codon:yes stop_codon:yes gene_type:complete